MTTSLERRNYYTTTEVASLLGYSSAQSVITLIKKGKMGCFRPGGTATKGIRRIKPEHLLDFLLAHRPELTTLITELEEINGGRYAADDAHRGDLVPEGEPSGTPS